MNGMVGRRAGPRMVGLLFLLSLVALGVRAGGQKAQAEVQALAFVSIAPQAYLVKKIASGRFRVEILVAPGQDPHTYEPTPQQMARLARASLYFRIGVAFEESLIPRIRSSNPELKIVDTREGIALRPLQDGGQNSEQGLDPHIWMSPVLARRQAETIRDALIAADPEGRQVYQAGYGRLAAELDALHREISAVLAPYRGQEFFVYHPAYGYFAAEYGLKQVAVETGGSEPSARQLAELIDKARARGVKIIFVQPQFSASSAKAVAEAIGGAVVPLDPLAEDYIENLKGMAAKVAAALGGADRRSGG